MSNTARTEPLLQFTDALVFCEAILLHDRKIRTFKENLPAWLRFDPQAELAQAPPEPGSREFRQMAQRHALVVMIHETLL